MTSRLTGDHPQRGIVFNIERYMVYDGPGIRTVVFLKGCPLRCRWCDNPESQKPDPQLMFFKDKCFGCGFCLKVCPFDAITTTTSEKVSVDLSRCRASGKCVERCPSEALILSGRAMTADEVMYEVLKDEVFYRRSAGGITLGGGEPSLQPDFAKDVLRKCREKHIHTAIETCGYSRWETMEQVLQYTELVYLDIKHMDPTEHVKLTGKSNDLILSNAEKIFQLCDARKLDVVVRCTCVPGYNDSKENVAELAKFVADANGKRFELLRYHELGVPKYGVLEREYKLAAVKGNEEHLNVLFEIVRSYGLTCQIL